MADDLTPEEAELLNKAKRERRRRRRHRWLIGIGVAFLVVAVALLAAYLYDLYWQHKVNVKYAQLRAQGKLLTFQEILARDSYLPPEQNSALVYLRAFKQLQETPQAEILYGVLDAEPLGARPSQTALDMLSSEATANAQALETLLQAAPLQEGCYPLEPAPSPWELLLPYCQELRRAARLCGRVAVLHAAAGSSAEATSYLLAGFGLASSFGRKGLLIEGLVRIAADTIALDALERSLALCEFTPQDLQTLKNRLDRERKELSLDWAMVSERSAAHFTFEHMVINRQSLASLWGGGLPRGYVLLPGWREKDEMFYDSMMDETERIRALPQRQALREMKQFGDAIGSRLEHTFPPPIVSAMLTPAISRSLQLEVQAKVQLAMAAAALAVEQYRLKNGRWPDSLEQLVPEFLDVVPEDYFGTGKVHYERTDTGVLLYSVGPDGQDNGGVTQAEANRTRQPGQPEAYDIPFRLLNPELRGAKTMKFREEVVGSGVRLEDLKAAGLDEDALKRLGLTDEDVKGLR
jgi:type II secretory pathway pseudopilin PulG